MTVVLISHPLCKLNLDIVIFFISHMFIHIVFEGNSTTLEESSFIFISPLIFIAFVIIIWVLSMKLDKSLPTKSYTVEFFSGVNSDKNK